MMKRIKMLSSIKFNGSNHERLNDVDSTLSNNHGGCREFGSRKSVAHPKG